jgi:hypothetical protein
MDALPPPDVSLNKSSPFVKYIHRHLRDADLYFFFNEGTEDYSGQADIIGNGQAKLWDAMSGKIEALPAVQSEKGLMQLNLELEGFESKFIVVGTLPKGM